jgi:hypothetical protein
VYEPELPQARGPLSEAVCEALRGDPLRDPAPPLADSPADPLGEDPQLALYICFELHYRSFEGVHPGWEWDPGLIAFRRGLETEFLDAVAHRVPRRKVSPDGVGSLLFELADGDSAPSLSRYLQDKGTIETLHEFMIHRSAYQLKEADPHTWAIPRMFGPPKAAMVEVQADEYGSGNPRRAHAELFGRAMEAVGLDRGYGAYLDRIPAVTLATVNLMSAFGLDRSRRGCLAGHLAMFEITSSIPNSRYAKALRRLGYEGEALEFFDEHVEADSVHENIAAYDLAQGLAQQQPTLAGDIVWGAESLLELEGAWAASLLEAWQGGRSSLLEPYESSEERTLAGMGSVGPLGAENPINL